MLVPSFQAQPALAAGPAFDAPHGATVQPNGALTFKVWAPHAASVSLLLRDKGATVPLERTNDDFSITLKPGVVKHGDAYSVLINTHDGHTFTRRDPYARAADYNRCDYSCFPCCPTSCTIQGSSQPGARGEDMYCMRASSPLPFAATGASWTTLLPLPGVTRRPMAASPGRRGPSTST
jgi:hypothetical protein